MAKSAATIVLLAGLRLRSALDLVVIAVARVERSRNQHWQRLGSDHGAEISGGESGDGGGGESW